MQEIKIGDIVRVIQTNTCLDAPKIGTLLVIYRVYDNKSFLASDSNNDIWQVVFDINRRLESGILVEKFEKTEQIEEVKEVKSFRMPTSSIRMWHKGGWKNCTSDGVELNWDMF